MIIKNQQDQHFVATKFIGIQQKLLNKHSVAESKFAKILLNSGFYFSREKCNYRIDNRWSFYDFHIPALDLYIEIDGLEHLSDKQQEIDRFKEIQIRRDGHKIIRYTNEEVMSMDVISIEDILMRIRNKFKKRKDKSLNKYKKLRIEDIAWAYAWQLDEFGDIVNTPNVCLYDNVICAFFVFDKLYDVNVATSIPMSKLVEMIDKTYTKKTRKYILSDSIDKCRAVASEIFGVNDIPIVYPKYPEYEVNERNVVISSNQYMESLITKYTTPHIFNERMYGINK